MIAALVLLEGWYTTSKTWRRPSYQWIFHWFPAGQHALCDARVTLPLEGPIVAMGAPPERNCCRLCWKRKRHLDAAARRATLTLVAS